MTSGSLFLKGIALGFAIAAPVGPIGILCIRRTLNRGMLHGFISGLGTATADACYGLLAALGLTAVTGFLLDHSMILQATGGLFLCYLGYKAATAPPPPETTDLSYNGLFRAYGSAFLLTLTNPLTIASFLGVFAALGIVSTATESGKSALLVAGVFSGSLAWWLVLSGSVSLLRRQFNPTRMILVNRIAGLIIGGFGIAGIFSAFT